MKIRANVSWNPKIGFEQSDLIDIVLSFENGESQEFRGQFKSPDNTMIYLESIYDRARGERLYVCGVKVHNLGKPVTEVRGGRTYEIPVIDPEKDLPSVKRHIEHYLRKHFIVTRNELVTNEEYYKFHGSSGGLWDTEKCDYPLGDFAETLRQTVYDMEHGNPDRYMESNVPHTSRLEERMKSDPQFKAFAIRSIFPLVDVYWNELAHWAGASAICDDIGKIKEVFNQIAEVAERYKQEHGIERL